MVAASYMWLCEFQLIKLGIEVSGRTHERTQGALSTGPSATFHLSEMFENGTRGISHLKNMWQWAFF